MKIALCDDERETLSELSSYVYIYFDKRSIDVTIDLFTCAEDFLASDQRYDILFMDIYLDGKNGIDAVRHMKANNNCFIIFSTSSKEYAVEAFGLNATHYLVKPLSPSNIFSALDRCMQRMDKAVDILEIKSGHDLIPISVENIIYIEVFNKISVVYTEKNSYQTYMSLDSLEKLLDKSSFLRVQRSYIVNMKYIESFYFDRVILHNNLEIKLSRANRSELKKQYQQYLFRIARKGDA